MKITELLGLLKTDKLPGTFDGVVGTDNGERAGQKRKHEGGGEEGDRTGDAVVPPVNDVYRSRQQKRVHVA